MQFVAPNVYSIAEAWFEADNEQGLSIWDL
jgi:hypothetical protein